MPLARARLLPDHGLSEEFPRKKYSRQRGSAGFIYTTHRFACQERENRTSRSRENLCVPIQRAATKEVSAAILWLAVATNIICGPANPRRIGRTILPTPADTFHAMV